MANTSGHARSVELILAQGSILEDVTFEERVAAAAAGGFSAIGLSLAEYDRLQGTGLSDEEMLCILAVYGIRVAELETVHGFAVNSTLAGMEVRPGIRYSDDESLERLLGMADLFHANHIQVTGAFHTQALEKDAVDRFGQLCDRAARHRLRVGLEYQACSNIPDVKTAAGIVAGANRPNGGLCIDSWHHFRGNNPLDGLAGVAAGKVVVIQINDGTARPQASDYFEDTLRNRQPPGTGSFDLGGLLNILETNGTAAPISVEVTSDNLRARNAFDLCSLLGESAARALKRAR